MKKRITQKDWNYIGTYSSSAKWVRLSCVSILEEVQEGVIKQEVKIGWFGYLLMFIPVHIFKVFWCLWDGGLKEYKIEGRNLAHRYFYEDDSPFCDYYKKAKEILERA